MQRRVSSDGGLCCLRRGGTEEARLGRDGSLAHNSSHQSPHHTYPHSESRGSVSEAVDELVFQTAVLPWPVVKSEGMHPVGPETEPPAALAHSTP